MSRKKSPSIQIINPVPGGSCYTNLRKALEYISRGRAVWDGNRLRFLELASSVIARNMTMRLRVPLRTVSQTGYDSASGSGIATEKERRGLPMVAQVDKAIYKGGNRISPKVPYCKLLRCESY